MEVPRSAIKSWCIGALTHNARVVLVKPRDVRAFADAVAEAAAKVEATLVAAGIRVVPDEGGNQ